MALQPPWLDGVQVAVVDQEGELGGEGGTPLNENAVQEIPVTLPQLPTEVLEAEGATAGYVPVAKGNGTYQWQAPAEASVPASTVLASGATASGQVPTADGEGGYAWDEPASPQPAASYVNSEGAQNGYVPVANGDNSYSWQEPSSGALPASPTLGGSATDIVTVAGYQLDSNTLVRNYGYNGAGQLSTLTYTSGATTVATIAYTYSNTTADAQLTTTTETCGTVTVTTAYTYNDNGQLETATPTVTNT